MGLGLADGKKWAGVTRTVHLHSGKDINKENPSGLSAALPFIRRTPRGGTFRPNENRGSLIIFPLLTCHGYEPAQLGQRPLKPETTGYP